jgi:hypothetical protein
MPIAHPSELSSASFRIFARRFLSQSSSCRFRTRGSDWEQNHQERLIEQHIFDDHDGWLKAVRLVRYAQRMRTALVLYSHPEIRLDERQWDSLQIELVIDMLHRLRWALVQT